MLRLGLIGHPVSHSWSERYYNERFAKEGIEAEYRLYDLKAEELEQVTQMGLDGFNVTIPYKEAILPYLAQVDEVAQRIGAVNLVIKTEKGLRGYNTDWIGFRESLKPWLKEGDRKALVFGSGGASKAVVYALKDLGIEAQVVSRKGPFRYEDVTKECLREHSILVNCTPLGMKGEWEGQKVAIDYEALTREHLLYDCVYTPQETAFLKAGREQGLTRLVNGEEMLRLQAEAGWKLIIDN